MSILAKREDVQHLRALCVFAVVIFHLDSSFLPNGYLGVDFFFVISGFVVWPLMNSCVTAAGDLDWKKLKAFFRRRIFRLLPALGVVLGLFSLATFLLGMLEDHRSIAAQGIAALLVMANVEAYSQSQGSYFHPNPNPLLHTWSLSAEEQVYLLVATALVLSTLLLKRKVKFLMVHVGILSILIASILRIFEIQQSGALFYSPLSRVWEFSLGAVASLAAKVKVEGRISVRAISITLASFMLIMPIEVGLIGQILGTCSIAIYLSLGGFRITQKPLNQALNWVGDRSYSIYLLHLPVIYICTRTYTFDQLNNNIRNLLSLTIMMFLSHLVYKAVEVPYRTKGRIPTTTFSSMKLLICFVLAPLLLMGALRVGSVNYYWKFAPPVIQGAIECVNVGNQGECESGNIQSKEIFVLVGDSHAAAVSQSFAKAAKSQGVKAVFFSGRGCQILGYRRNQELFPSETCRTYTMKIAEYLSSHQVNRVFVMQRSSSIQDNMPASEYRASILEGLRSIKFETNNLTVIGPTPEYQVGFGQGSIKDLVKGEGWQKREKLLDSSFQDDFFYQRTLPKYGIEYLKTTNTFCTNLQCQFLDRGGYFYWDNNHLSLRGADRLRDMFVSALARDLND